MKRTSLRPYLVVSAPRTGVLNVCSRLETKNACTKCILSMGEYAKTEGEGLVSNQKLDDVKWAIVQPTKSYLQKTLHYFSYSAMFSSL